MAPRISFCPVRGIENDHLHQGRFLIKSALSLCSAAHRRSTYWVKSSSRMVYFKYTMLHSHSSVRVKISNHCLSIYSQDYLSLRILPFPFLSLLFFLSPLFSLSTFNFLLYTLLFVSLLYQYCIELVFVTLYLRTLQ